VISLAVARAEFRAAVDRGNALRLIPRLNT
jgi:hypothetical protein